jgi:hypothetical protein
MKLSSVSKITLLACVLGAVSLVSAGAQDSDADSSSTPSSGGNWHHDSVLTQAERDELKNDWEKATTANPDLQTEAKDLWEQRTSMKDASEEDRQAYRGKWQAFADKAEAAIEGIDSNAAPLIAKVKAAFFHHWKNGSDSSAGSNNP